MTPDLDIFDAMYYSFGCAQSLLPSFLCSLILYLLQIFSMSCHFCLGILTLSSILVTLAGKSNILGLASCFCFIAIKSIVLIIFVKELFHFQVPKNVTNYCRSWPLSSIQE